MGLIDAIVADDRIDLKVSDLWNILYSTAEIGAEYQAVLKMLHMKDENGVSVFTKQQVEQFTKERVYK